MEIVRFSDVFRRKQGVGGRGWGVGNKKVTSYGLRVAGCGLRVLSGNAVLSVKCREKGVASCGLRGTGYGL